MARNLIEARCESNQQRSFAFFPFIPCVFALRRFHIVFHPTQPIHHLGSDQMHQLHFGQAQFAEDKTLFEKNKNLVRIIQLSYLLP